MKILAFAASLRKGSYNKKLITIASSLARERGLEVDLRDFAEFRAPIYNFDDEEATGIPEGPATLGRLLGEVSGVMISSPEYNNSVPGPLKNLIDWVSRIRPMPLRDKHGLLLSASPSLVGGNRALWALRVPLEVLGVTIHPAMFSLARAQDAFTDAGMLKDAQLEQRLIRALDGYIRLARGLESQSA